ncbi:MAG: toxin-antitoxin system protein [Clostridiales bacterium]|nr:MAG: toxin-antitoxin system protein [Clostridiales bacterium]
MASRSMKPLKQTVSITLDPDLLAQIRVLAEEEDRPVSQYINRALKKVLLGRERQIKKGGK